ncbi:hypothetical protein, partial [Pseudomonas sp. SDO55104_S430]
DGSIPPSGSDLKNVYTAPQRDPTMKGRSFTIDQVVVRTAQHVQSSPVVVTHGIQGLSMFTSFEGLPAGQAQYSATFNNDVVPAAWSLFPETGAGTIDETGLYTQDPDSHYQFVIIMATFSAAGYFMGDAFRIQPFPLEPLPSKPDPEDPQLGPDGMPDA